jgi:YVTN family beta-propeller protein
MMLSTNWGANTATLFNRRTGAFKAAIPTGRAPDAAIFEPVSRRVFVMNGKSNDVTVIDVDKLVAVATIPLGGKPEAATSDAQGRLYVNIEDTAEVAIIDVATLQVVGRHSLPGCKEPTGLAYDARSGLLMSACHNRTVKLIDAKRGTDRGTVTVGNEADGAIFDDGRRLAVIPCNDGTLTIFGLDVTGKPTVVDVVTTQEGARTAALDPKTGRIYLVAMEFETGAAGEREPVAGTFNVLVVAPR